MGISSIFTCNNLIIGLFCVYMVHTGTIFYKLLHPDLVVVREHPETGRKLATIKPSWNENTPFTVEVHMSPDTRLQGARLHKVWSTEELSFNWNLEQDDVSLQVNLTMDDIPNSYWDHLQDNGALFLYYNITNTKSKESVMAVSQLVRYVPYTKPKPVRYLVQDVPFLGSFVPQDLPVVEGVPAALPAGTQEPEDGMRIGYWKPTASVHIVADWTHWPKQTTPFEVRKGLRVSKKGTYLPVVYTDQLGLTQDKLIQLNRTMVPRPPVQDGVIRHDGGVLPLEIRIAPMTVARWQFNAHMESALETQKKLGFGEKELDDMRLMLTETPPLLLLTTIVVSLLHILFDVLAFKNDVSFWKNTESMKGLSLRTIAMETVSSVIITAYLHEDGASLLILAPSAIGIVVQLWKLQKAYGMERHDILSNDDQMAQTRESDSYAMKVMVSILVPLVVAYSMYSLVYEKHVGFYSWAVKSLASCVYAFGFAMMTPQLFINYKLKSVAHLPWRFLIYRSLNTFIDDLFAFIIRMPNMHRAAVFRDDLVFFIYLYQRWIYPVDHERKESPMGDEVDTPAAEAKKKKKDQ